jgi:hypothetical protein
MDNSTVPLFPSNQPLHVWLVVIACFVFWLAAYALIIKRGFQDKTFGMPIAALCANFTWEIVFSHLFLPSFQLIRLGNKSWVFLDAAILITALKYGREDFRDPFVRKWFYWLLALGMAVAACVEIPFVKVYGDVHGYFLGWAAALMMSILFIAMLLRRGSVKGQSCYIALFMLLGNVSAYLWCKYFPDTPPLLDPRVNLAFLATTGFFNATYLVLLYRKCREQGINPWTRF